MRRSHHPKGGSAQRFATWAWATRLTALFAVFLQAFVVQLHVHAYAPLAAAGYERAADDASPVSLENAARHEGFVACAVCQAQSAGSPLTPASTTVLGLGDSGAFDPPAEIRRVSVAPAHSWQSRAPPAHL